MYDLRAHLIDVLDTMFYSKIHIRQNLKYDFYVLKAPLNTN